MRHNHHPEHRTFPANKSIPKTTTESGIFKASRLSSCSPNTKKVMKKTHTRRSRQFLKRIIENDNIND